MRGVTARGYAHRTSRVLFRRLIMTEATLLAWWALQALLAVATGSHAIPPVCN